MRAVTRWRAQDKLVLVDLDEAIDLLEEGGFGYPFWYEGFVPANRRQSLEADEKIDPAPIAQLKWGLRQVNGVIVSSAKLENDWFAHSPVYHCPDYPELDRYRNTMHLPHEGIMIGLGNNNLSKNALYKSGISTALERVCRQRPNVAILMSGLATDISSGLEISPEQKKYVPWRSTRSWLGCLAQIDIGLAPLAGEFDQRQGWRSVLEYILMKIPWAASEGFPYHDLSSYGWLVKDDPDAWESVILNMVDHLDDYRNEAAGEPYLFGLSQDIDDNINQVLSIYQSALNDMAAGV